MAAVGSAWSFWKTVSSVSPKTIEEEAATAFKLALVGEPEARTRLREALLQGATETEREEALNYLRDLDAAPDADASKAFAFVLYAPENESDPIGARGDNAEPVTAPNPAALAKVIVEKRPGLSIALARRFPLFRPAASNYIIQNTSRVNATVALMSALPGIIPISAIFLPASSIADTILITKNQVMMIMRLAAAHGKKPAYTKQVKELLGVVGGALGWRTVARELAGYVPAGVGVALKASIAFSGTMATGKAALWYYQSGKQPTAEQVKQAYKESEAEAQKAVATLKVGE